MSRQAFGRAALVVGALAATCAWAADGASEERCMLPPGFETLWPAPDEVHFRATTLEERAAFEALVPELVRAAPKGATPPKDAVARAAKVGFRIDVWRAGPETFWVLRERADALRGAGAYVFRTGEATDVILQAPHAYFDLHTGALAARLFTCAPRGFRPRVFLTNTAHRYKGRAGERRDDPDHPADVAHNPDHLFQLATNAAVQTLPQARIVQVHGFGGGAGTSERGEVAAVVSSGTREPAPFTRGIARRLGAVLGDGVRLFPEDTEELGATQNAQGRLLQAYPKARFVHIELSAPLRRALGDSAQLPDVAKALFAPEDASE